MPAMKEPVRTGRSVAAGALGLIARGMAVGSLITRTAADRLRVERENGGQQTQREQPRREQPTRGDEGPGPVRLAEARLHPPAEEEQEPGRVLQPPTEPSPEVPEHARAYETHLEELADMTAAEIIDKVPSLSTDELRRLWEHESANKKRKTVLQAIEAQGGPDHA
jgi:hypothetical protein